MPQDLDKAYQKIVQYSDRMFRNLDKMNRADYVRALRAARAVVADAYARYGRKGVLTYAEMQKYDRLKKLDDMLYDAIYENTNHVAANTRRILGETAVGSFDKSAAAMGTVTGSVITKELSAAEIMEILQKPITGITLNERMALRRTDLVIRVKGEVRRRLLQSAPIEDTGKGVKVEMEKVYARDRTQLADDFHRVSEEAIRAEVELEKKSGLFPTLTWISAGDERVRGAHQLLDGQTVDAGDPFVIPSGKWKGYQTYQPGGFGEPALDYNCRCYVVAGVRETNAQQS